MATPRSGGLGRLAQVTYTSYQPPTDAIGNRPGGWQIKEQTGPLSETERQLVSAAVLTDLRSPVPLSRFPTRAELDDRPRRLHFSCVDGTAVYCSSVNAGPDASGRPDNVFNHLLVDRDPYVDVWAETPARPVERWGSDRWLCPYGADDVRVAVLDPDRPPEPGGSLTRSAVVRFLFDPENYRFGTLGFLLDAVSAALRGGPPVVLAVSDHAEGALWVAAVSFLASPGACLRLSFSTYGRLGASGPSLVLSVVPAEDVRNVAAAGAEVVVVEPDTGHEVRATDSGEVWVDGQGKWTAMTDWSRLMLHVGALGPEPYADVLATVDEVSRVAGPSADHEPGWPLAMAVAQHDELRDSWSTAGRLIRRGPPPSTISLPDSMNAALRRATTGDDIRTTAEAWAMASNGLAGQVDDPFGLYETYLGFALRDQAWLALRPPVLPRPGGGSAARATVLAFLGSQPSDLGPVPAVRLLDFCARVLADGPVPVEEPGPRRLAEIVADGLFDHTDIRAGVKAVGPLSPGAARWLGPALMAGGATAGDRLHPVLARWLWPGYSDEVEATPPGRAHGSDPVVLELLVQHCREDFEFARRHRVTAAVTVLDHQGPVDPVKAGRPPALSTVLAELSGRPRRSEPDWTDVELIRLAARLPDERVDELVDIVILRLFDAPWNARRRTLAEAVRDRLVRLDRSDRSVDLYLTLTGNWYVECGGFAPQAMAVLLEIDATVAFSPEERTVFLPHRIVAAYQVMVAQECPEPGNIDAMWLRDAAAREGVTPSFPKNADDDVWMTATRMLQQAFKDNDGLMEMAVAACQLLLVGGRSGTSVLTKLPEVRGRIGVDLTSAVLIKVLEEWEPARIASYRQHVERAWLGGPPDDEALDRWWNQFAPSPAPTGGRLARAVRGRREPEPKDARRTGSADRPEPGSVR